LSIALPFVVCIPDYFIEITCTGLADFRGFSVKTVFSAGQHSASTQPACKFSTQTMVIDQQVNPFQTTSSRRA
jgi:hypothetical protein